MDDKLLDIKDTPGEITEAGLVSNIDIALQYLAAWLAGNGAVGIHNLMEDAATAEISRSQIWQQVHNNVTYKDSGNLATKELIIEKLKAEEARLIAAGFEPEKINQAAKLFERVSLDDDFADFLTLPALEMIN